MRADRVFAIFVLFLVFLSINALVVSASLVVITASGSAGLKNFRAVNDTVTINITSTNGTITLDGAENLCTCDKRGLYYCKCTTTDEKNVNIADYELGNGLGDTATASFKVDNSIGDINNFNITTRNGNVTLRYTIVDTGFNGNAECSKIAMLEVFVAGSSVNMVEINSTACSVTGNLSLNVFDSGMKEVYLSVTDSVGNTKTSNIKNFTVDVTPPEVSNIKFISNGKELETLAQGIEFPVDIHFDVAEDSLANITADLSGIHNNPAITQQYKNINVPVSSCQRNTSATPNVFSCKILAKVLKVQRQSVNITIKATDTSGIETWHFHEKSFTIDNVRPESTITTNYCTSINCYVKNGMNVVNVKLTKDNFETRQVYFSVGDSNSRVSNCTGGECFGRTNVNCVSGKIRASILTVSPYKSQDDSGNPLPSYSVDFTCDNTPPVIRNITIVGNEFGGEIITTRSELKIKAFVYEIESDAINATANFGQMKNNSNISEPGLCTKNSTMFVCEWTVRNPAPGYYDTSIVVNVSDIVGNTAHLSKSVRVLGLMQNNLTPDNLAISLEEMQPSSGINRITLDMATRNNVPFFVFAKYSIRVWKGQNVRMLTHDTSIDNCRYVDEQGRDVEVRNIFSELKVADKNINITKGDIGRLDLIFGSGSTLDSNSLADNFKIYCNITAYVQEDKFVYEIPQILTLEIPMHMRNSKLGTPGQAFVDKITDAESGFVYKMKVLGFLNDWLPRLQQICRINDYLNMVQFAGQAMVIVGEMIKPTFGPGLSEAGFTLEIDVSSIVNCIYGDERSQNAAINAQLLTMNKETGQRGDVKYQHSVGKCTNFVKDACSFLGCKASEDALNKDFSKDDDGKPLSGFDPTNLKNVGGYITRDIHKPDVSNSIYWAAKTQCYPAVVHNLNKIRQLDCGYVYCLKESSLKGTDISVCDTSYNVQLCTLVTGQLFETINPLRYFKNIGANIADLLNNVGPLALASTARLGNCDKYLDLDAAKIAKASKDYDSTELFLCQIPLSISRFVDHRMRTARASQFNYPQIPDMCQVAQCVGQETCEGRKDIWSTLGSIPITKYDQRQYEYVKNQVDNRADLSNELVKTVNSLPKEYRQEYMTMSKTERDLYSEGVKTIMSGTLLDPENSELEYKGLKWNEDLEYAFKLQKEINQIDKNIRGGNEELEELLKKENIPYDSVPPYLRESYMRLDAESIETNLKEIERIDALIARANSQQLQAGDDEIVNPEGLYTQRALAMRSLHQCGSIEECRNMKMEPGKVAELRQRISFANDVSKAQQFGNTLTMALDFLYANHMLDWMMTGSWSTGLFRIAQFFDPDRWMSNMCNPETRIIGPTFDTGNVVTCDAGICRTVLTMAAEKQLFINQSNSRYYMYTVAVYAGPVYYSDLRQNIKYNILFKSNSGQVLARGYKNDQLFKENMINTVQKVFLHVKDFDKMCVTFSEAYPPKELAVPFTDGKREYCREIKSIDFDTGGVSEEPEGNPPAASTYSGAPQTGTGQSPGEKGVFE